MFVSPQRVAAFVVTAFGFYVTIYSWTRLDIGTIRNPDAGLLPLLIGVSFIVLGALWIIDTGKDSSGAEKAIEPRKMAKPLKALMAIVIYTMIFKPLGYVTSTLIFTVIWQLVVEKQSWLSSVSFAILSAGGMYFLFVFLLKAPLPMEFFLR